MDCTITSMNLCTGSKGNKKHVSAKMKIAERPLARGAIGLDLSCVDEIIKCTGERSPDAGAIYERRAELYLSPEELLEIVRAAARIGIRIESQTEPDRRALTLVKK